ncbi:MAG: hypothetical protein HYX24_07680 [Candidatus Aenigmarchaeota archaeon]|nr:hypothetical protein [Candidatus Aenigmarchaeota archaeon]
MKGKTLATKLRILQKKLPAGEDLDDSLRREIEEHKGNPIVSEGISGNPSYPAEYVSDLSRRKWGELRGLRPHREDKAYNQEVKTAGEIFTQTDGFITEGLASSDNPLGLTAGYGSGVYLLSDLSRFTISLPDESIQNTITGAAAVWGLVQGGRDAYKKWEKRKATLKEARWLSRLFSRLYKSEEPLVTRLKKLEQDLPQGEELDDSLRKEIEKRRGNPVIDGCISDPSYPMKHVSALYTKKWEMSFIYFPRLFSSLFPHRRDAEYNKGIMPAKKLFPQADGFLAEGVFVSDNPIGTATKYSLTAFAIVTAAKYALPLFGVQLDEKTIDDARQELTAYASLLGTYIGGRDAYRKWLRRESTFHEAEWLSRTFSRLYR